MSSYQKQETCLVKPLLRGHPNVRPTPPDNVNLNINNCYPC